MTVNILDKQNSNKEDKLEHFLFPMINNQYANFDENSKEFLPNEDDELFQIVSKAYMRIAYPIFFKNE